MSYAQIHIPSLPPSCLLDRNGRREVRERVAEDTIRLMLSSFEAPQRSYDSWGVVGGKFGGVRKDLEGNNGKMDGGVDKTDGGGALHWEHFSYSMRDASVDSCHSYNGENSDVKYSFQQISQFLSDSLNHPLTPYAPSPPPLQSRSVCLTNLLHQSDLILRKCVKAEINRIKGRSRCQINSSFHSPQ